MHCCVSAGECGVVSSISTIELLHRRDRPFGCLRLDIVLVLLLRGDLAKSLSSALLAELRFRAPPLCFFYGSRPSDS